MIFSGGESAPKAQFPPLAAADASGFSDVRLSGGDYRVYSLEARRERTTIHVAQPLSVRTQFAQRAAGRMAGLQVQHEQRRDPGDDGFFTIRPVSGQARRMNRNSGSGGVPPGLLQPVFIRASLRNL